MIHMTYNVLGRNTTCLSFVALDKSIGSANADSSASGSPSQVLVPTQKSKERTRQAILEIKAFKGIRTPRQQSRQPRKAFHEPPHAHEFPKVKTIRQA